MLSTGGSWAQRVVCGAVGRPHGGPEPRLGLWGDPLATGMPAWVVVGLNGAHLLNPLISPCLVSKPAPPTPAPTHSRPKTPLCAHTAVFWTQKMDSTHVVYPGSISRAVSLIRSSYFAWGRFLLDLLPAFFKMVYERPRGQIIFFFRKLLQRATSFESKGNIGGIF